MAERPEGTKHRRAFERYWRLGAERSIERLRAALAVEDKAPSLRTLYAWSSRYHWQARLADLEREARRVEGEVQIREIREMRERQAKLGLLLQQKGASCIAVADRSAIPVTTAVRMIAEGAKLEREARGDTAAERAHPPEPEPQVVEVRLHMGGSKEDYQFPLDEAPAQQRRRRR